MKGVVTLINADTTGSLTGATFTPTYSARGYPLQPVVKFQAYETGTGAITATVLIEGSNDATYSTWVTLATITLSGTTTTSDGYATIADWPNVRARTTAISGTSAAVTVTMAI